MIIFQFIHPWWYHIHYYLLNTGQTFVQHWFHIWNYATTQLNSIKTLKTHLLSLYFFLLLLWSMSYESSCSHAASGTLFSSLLLLLLLMLYIPSLHLIFLLSPTFNSPGRMLMAPISWVLEILQNLWSLPNKEHWIFRSFDLKAFPNWWFCSDSGLVI